MKGAMLQKQPFYVCATVRITKTAHCFCLSYPIFTAQFSPYSFFILRVPQLTFSFSFLSLPAISPSLVPPQCDCWRGDNCCKEKTTAARKRQLLQGEGNCCKEKTIAARKVYSMFLRIIPEPQMCPKYFVHYWSAWHHMLFKEWWEMEAPRYEDSTILCRCGYLEPREALRERLK